MHKVQYRPLPTARVGLDPVMIRASIRHDTIYVYVDMGLLDPLLPPRLESIGEDTASVYDWRPEGPGADPIVTLRVHRVPQVSGGQLAVAELEPGVVNLSIDKELIRGTLASAIAVHATEMMRLMQ